MGTALVLVAGGGVFWWWWNSHVPHPGRYGYRTITFAAGKRLMHQALPQEAAVPTSGGGGRPLLVLLHGRGSSYKSPMSNQLFSALQALGPRAPDVISLNGDDASYFHDRRTGKWGTYVVSEVIPQATRVLHADPRRVSRHGRPTPRGVTLRSRDRRRLSPSSPAAHPEWS